MIDVLLQATDKEFKDQVGLLLELKTWEEAAVAAAGLLASSERAQNKLSGSQEFQRTQLATLQSQVRSQYAALC